MLVEGSEQGLEQDETYGAKVKCKVCWLMWVRIRGVKELKERNSRDICLVESVRSRLTRNKRTYQVDNFNGEQF